MATIRPEEAVKHWAEACVIDVREPAEYAKGHLPQARLLPLRSLDAARAAALIPSSDALVYAYCRSGQRSAAAVRKLRALGYTNAYNLGGILDWPYEVEM